MSDLISRQAAIDSIEKHIRTGDELYPLTRTDKILNHAFEIAASCVYNLPAADVAPVRRGRWVKMSDADGYYFCCSECGEELYRKIAFEREFDLFPTKESIDKTNFCPNCGAKMDGGDGDD